jgi:adenylate cyclase
VADFCGFPGSVASGFSAWGCIRLWDGCGAGRTPRSTQTGGFPVTSRVQQPSVVWFAPLLVRPCLYLPRVDVIVGPLTMSGSNASDLMGRSPDRRKLIAVVYADMVGYSRLIGLDDVGTLERLRTLRSNLIDPAIDEHGGRIVQTGGDSLLIVFDSIDGAVRCASQVQQQVPNHDRDQPPDRTIRFRVGINIGDAITDGTDLHGDAVNIAARIQAECPPGGICVTRAVRDHVQNRLDLVFEELGALSLKNIARTVEAFVVSRLGAEVSKSVERSFLSGEHDTLPLPDKPSVAVLAFTNMSGDIDQEYFSDGIADDIITELSRSRSLFVIARNSGFTYKGHAVDVKQVARELGVRYVVEGSVRRNGDRIRVTAQLIETETANHIWAERYDRNIADVFKVQDEITGAVTLAIEPAIADVEQQRAARKPPGNLSAWEAYQRGLWHWARINPADNAASLQFFERATKLDPMFSRAYQACAHALAEQATLNFTRSIAEAYNLAEPLARKAIVLDPNDGSAHAILGALYGGRGDAKAALASAELALELEPDSPLALNLKGLCLIYFGNLEEACESLRRCLRRNPFDKRNCRTLSNLSKALYLLGSYAEAAEAAARALQVNAGFTTSYGWLVAALGQLGRKQEAEEVISRTETALGISFDNYLRRQYPLRTDEQHARLLEGLRKVGWQG